MAGPAYFDAFRRIVVQPDNITIAADAVDDTLTLVAGPGISLVANANNDQLTIVNTNSAQFSLGVAGDDSSIKVINSGETIRFAGAQNVTVSADSEGAITITGPDLSGYLTTETDPVYTASSWYTTTNNSSDWDAAYSWGDHAVAGYLTSWSFNVAGDDSTQRTVNNSNTIKFIGDGDVSTSTDEEGNVIISASIAPGTLGNIEILNIAADDSTQKLVRIGETIKFIGASNITTSTDSEGNVTITGPDLSSYLTAETDPVYTASTWYTTTNNSADWDTAYSWGDHSIVGYLTSIPNEITFGSVKIGTNVVQTVDSNTDLELRASGTGAVLVESITVNGTNIDSADSSAITITPDVVFQAGVTVGNHIVPSSNENIDLGSASFRFRDLYLSGSTIKLGDATISASGSNISLPAGTTIGGSSILTFSGGTTPVNVNLTSGDFSNGFSSVGVASYLLVALPAGTYNITITNLALDGGFGASVLLSTDQNASSAGDPGVFDSVSRTDGDPGPATHTFTSVTSAEPFYIIFDQSTGELTATGVSYTTSEETTIINGDVEFTGTVTGITASTVGLGNVTNESKATMFTNPTFTGTVSGVTATHVGLGNVTNESKATMFASPTFTGTATFVSTIEVLDNKTSATGTVTHDLSTSAVWVHTSISGNFTANFTNVPALVNKSLTVSLILVQSGTGRMATAVQVNGSAQSITWIGGSTPSGTANATDVVNFTFLYDGAGSLIRCLGSVTTYG